MDRKKIGIIGGAGPSAGSLLFEKTIEVFQHDYGCRQDFEFPYMVLLNFPFSDMLAKNSCDATIQKELLECLCFLEKNGVELIAIACNTLHAFLPSLSSKIRLVHMIEETKIFLENQAIVSPLVLCTTTSSSKKLHEKYFPCDYPEIELQKMLDKMIADITLGSDLEVIAQQLSQLLPDRPLLLGCTEFSYLHDRVPLRLKTIYDPNEIVAKKIASLYFSPDAIPPREFYGSNCSPA